MDKTIRLGVRNNRSFVDIVESLYFYYAGQLPTRAAAADYLLSFIERHKLVVRDAPERV